MASGGSKTNSERVPTPPLPEGCHPLEHQVAGHIHGQGKTKAGMLQYVDGTILKAMQRPPRGLRELDFYENVFRDDQEDSQFLSLQQFLPRFLGTFRAPDSEITYLKLDDITQRFSKPCILDVKMGRQVYEKGASKEKAELARKKYPPLEKVGFQLLGMRIYHPSIDEYVFYDKTYGRSLDEDQVIEGLARYLNSDEDLRTDVIPTFIQKLEEIQRWFEQQTRVHFFSSSLLLVYEGDVPESSDDESETHTEYGSNVVSYSELEMKDSDARESKLVKESTSLPPPPPTHYECKANQEKFCMDLHMQNMKLCHENRPNGLVGVNTGLDLTDTSLNAEEYIRTDHVEHNGVTEHQTKGLTVAEMRAKQKSKLGPPSVIPAATANSDSDWFANNATCDASYPMNNFDSSMQACAAEPANPITSSINEDLVEVKIIDFAHVIPSDSIDESYLYGLKRLIQHFKTLNVCGFEY
ncbi:inositol polyphosphate multikinase-like [Glandiceps talaboti]